MTNNMIKNSQIRTMQLEQELGMNDYHELFVSEADDGVIRLSGKCERVSISATEQGVRVSIDYDNGYRSGVRKSFNVAPKSRKKLKFWVDNIQPERWL